MSETLESVIADARGELPILRKRGQGAMADAIAEYMDRVQSAAEDFLRFISEDDARLQSGKTAAWLRARFPEWRQSGNAELRGRARYYRALVVPRRLDLDAARAAGKAAEPVAPVRRKKAS